MLSSAFERVPSFLQWKSYEVHFEEVIPDLGGFRTDTPELTAAEFVTGGVVHWPIASLSTALGIAQGVAEGLEPLFELIGRAIGKASDEAVIAFEKDLRGVNYDSLDDCVEDDFTREGI